jgi:hypothetical protein
LILLSTWLCQTWFQPNKIALSRYSVFQSSNAASPYCFHCWQRQVAGLLLRPRCEPAKLASLRDNYETLLFFHVFFIHRVSYKLITSRTPELRDRTVTIRWDLSGIRARVFEPKGRVRKFIVIVCAGHAAGRITCCKVVLTMSEIGVGQWMTIGLNGPLTGPKPLHRSKPNALNTIHYVRGNSSRAKTHHQPIKRAQPTKGQHISFLLIYFLFWILFVSCHHVRLGWFWRSIRQSTQSHGRRCLLMVQTRDFSSPPLGFNPLGDF